MTCGCTKTTLTSSGNAGVFYSSNSANFSSGGISGGSGYQYGGNTYQLSCNVCGGPFGACSCCAAPLINPNSSPFTIFPSTWTGTTIDTGTIYQYLKVLDVETKERYDHSGFFKAERKDEKDGIYGNLTGLILPATLKDVFAPIRKEESFKLWQIRSPLTFQVDFQIDASKEESHYFTLVSVKDVEIGEEKIILSDPRFQEIPNPIDLCQLIELQRVFTKLLRRI